MKITNKMYHDSMENLLELYDEYKEIAPDELYNQCKNSHHGLYEIDGRFIALEHGSLIEKNFKSSPDIEVIYTFNDFYTTVTYYKNDSLTICELLDVTKDGLVIFAEVSDVSGEVEFKVEIRPMYL
ncbi:hypothetical protein OCB02_08785 [Bacillus cereus]|uniref:hypothetical protein n=1 Tax=Bacillus cereus TaxID=1396 RepID=UPI001E3AFC72|nr:hypothetical protein [Bacillus cereus]MCU5475838.1 hypothetical protein [Bacillus cereus]MCU5613137.1 hypothetical protein [Bacillus cereus]